MRLTLISPEPPFDADAMTTGLQWRMDQLARGLEAAGIEVERVHVDTHDGVAHTALDAHLEDTDAVLVGYWQLLEMLPADPGVPVIADCVAPRPLEVQFSDPDAADLFAARYRQAIARADLLLAGNRRQRWLLAAWLVDAGEDIRKGIPVAVTPLAAEPANVGRTAPGRPLVVVAGGRDWPWRHAGRWLAHLAGELDPEAVHLEVFGGDTPAGARARPHLSWRQWSDYLATTAHVGLELADYNPEREASQSYRLTGFLQAGLPVIVNDYLELADAVRRYGAGWVVSEPAQAVAAIRALQADPGLWAERARGARELARAEMTPDTTLAELRAWLAAPRRRPHRAARAPDSPATHVPTTSLSGRLARMVLGAFRRRIDGDGVVVVTRADLFPPDHGAAVKIIETLRALAGCGRNVALVTASRKHWWEIADGQLARRRLPWWLRLTGMPAPLAYVIHRLRGGPPDNAFLYWPLSDPTYGLRATWAGRHIGAGVYLAEFPGYGQAARMARYLNGGAAVLAEHNVEYDRIREQSPSLSERQYDWLRTVEIHETALMDAVVCVSHADRRKLAADGADPARLLVIPHGVSLADYDRAEAAGAETFGLDASKPVLVYHGTYSYPPNRQALNILAHEILPRLEDRGRPCQVLAVGSHPPVLPGRADIAMPGSLESLTGALKTADLAVVPLVAGGGTRMKILDYFAAGVPVIATAKGCEGLPVEDSNQLLVRDDWDGMVDGVIELLDNPPTAKRLAAAARTHAESLDWSEIGKRYDELFRDLDVNRKS